MLSKDFIEFIELLNAHNVHYLAEGGYAVALHGHPRYIKDLDVWIELSPENAKSIINALKEFVFGSLGIKQEDFLESEQFIQLVYPPNQIDILTTLTEIQFEKCYKEKLKFKFKVLK